MRMSRLSAVSALVAALTLGACAGEETEVAEVGEVETGAVAPVADAGVDPVAENGFGQWDVDRNASLASNEFGTYMRDRGIFNRWSGGDTGIDRDEFGRGALGLWDRDRDSRVTETEWTEGVRGWYDDDSYGAFGDWDLNDDAALDATEIGQGFETTNRWSVWDTNRNNMLEENEFGEGAFGAWDTNRDSMLDENEWTAGSGLWES